MRKSATEVMQEIVFAAVIDGIAALKAASKGLPNTLLRDLNSVHANTTFADLSPELQAAIAANARAAFSRLMKEGYAIGPAGAEPARPSRPTGPPDRPRRPDRPHGQRPPPRRDGSERGPRGRPGGPKRPR